MKRQSGFRVKRKRRLQPRARRMREAGCSFREISRTLGVSLRTSWVWTNEQPG